MNSVTWIARQPGLRTSEAPETLQTALKLSGDHAGLLVYALIGQDSLKTLESRHRRVTKDMTTGIIYTDPRLAAIGARAIMSGTRHPFYLPGLYRWRRNKL